MIAPCSAEAVTVGQASSGSLFQCGNGGSFFVQTSLAPVSPSYTIPPGGGIIDRWSTGTMGATPGAQITLLVLQPTSSTTYRVVAFDTQQLPNPPPSGNIATFAIAPALSVPAGSVLGLLGGPTGMVGCLGLGGAQDGVSFGTASPPMVDASYTQTTTAANRLLNVEVNLVQSTDVGVVSSATPATINAGGVGFLRFSISN